MQNHSKVDRNYGEYKKVKREKLYVKRGKLKY